MSLKDAPDDASPDYSSLEDSDGGLDYRTIADIMTVDGRSMGHSTVRNIILRAMERFAASLMAAYGVTGDPADIARSATFQRLVASHMQDIYSRRTQGRVGNAV